MNIMELYYWAIGGRAEAIRYELALFNLEYKEINPTSPEEFQKLAAEKQFLFANLPYFVDGDVKLAESSAIPKYIAWKAGKKDFFGKEGLECAQHQQIIGVLDDLSTSLYPIVTSDNYAELFTNKKEWFDRKFKDLSKFISNKKFFFGDQPTFSDLKAVTIIDSFQKITDAIKQPSLFENYGNLPKLADNVKTLPEIKKYLETDERAKRPTLPPSMVKLQF